MHHIICMLSLVLVMFFFVCLIIIKMCVGKFSILKSWKFESGCLDAHSAQLLIESLVGNKFDIPLIIDIIYYTV